MANYYTNFSFQFAVTQEDYDNFLEVISIDFEDPESAQVPRFLSDRFADVAQLGEFLFDGGCLGFGIEYEPSPGYLGIYDEGGCSDIDAVAKLVQLCFPAELPIGFEWSNTCDKPRTDAFGGGWVAIFADRIESGYTSTALAQHLAAGKHL